MIIGEEEKVSQRADIKYLVERGVKITYKNNEDVGEKGERK